MSLLLHITTLILNFSGVMFAIIYIWLNTKSKVTDLAERSMNIRKIINTTIFLSIVFAFLSGMLSGKSDINKTIDRISVIYAIIAVSWLVVILILGIVMTALFLGRDVIKSETTKSLKGLFVISIWTVLFSVVFSWILS